MHKELDIVKLYIGRGVDVGHIAEIAEIALRLVCRHKELPKTRRTEDHRTRIATNALQTGHER